MTIGEAVGKRIDELLKEKGWSYYKLSKEACIPLSTIKNLYYNHTKSPTLKLVFLFAQTFGMSVTEFLDAPVFTSEELELY